MEPVGGDKLALAIDPVGVLVASSYAYIESTSEIAYHRRVAGWTREIVDVGDAQTPPAVSAPFFDASGVPHIAYVLGAGWPVIRLAHAWRVADGEWETEDVPLPEGASPHVPNLAIAPDGSIHIVFCLRSIDGSSEVDHAEVEGGTWTVERLDSGCGCAAAFGGDGLEHVIYSNDSVFHTWRDPEGWHSGLVSEAPASQIVIAADYADGSLRALYDGDPRGVVYTSLVDSIWVTQATFASGGDSTGLGLAIDPAGEPHVAQVRDGFSVERTSQLFYLVRSGDMFEDELVDDSMRGQASIVIDPNGVPHIGYNGWSAATHAVLGLDEDCDGLDG
jgi:hypothetical protein